MRVERDLTVQLVAPGALNMALVNVLFEPTGGAVFGLLVVVNSLWCVWNARHGCLCGRAADTLAIGVVRQS